MSRVRSNPYGRWGCLCITAALLLSGPASAYAGGGQGGTLEAEVVKKDLPIEVELSGTFEAEDKDELRVEPKAYKGDLIVTSLVPEGTEVKKDDVLMEFDQDNLDRALEDARNEVTDKEVARNKAQADHDAGQIDQQATLHQLETELEMAKLAAEGAAKKAKHELEDKQAKDIKDAKDRLADAKVDFEQLKQLYVERELHTATENILIEREQRQIENLELALKNTVRDVEHYKTYENQEDVKTKGLEVNKKEAELKKKQIEFSAELAEKSAAASKAQRELDKAKRELGKYEEDGKHLSLLAPRDGIVFYGSMGNEMPAGVMMFGGGAGDEMRIGGRVRTHQILITVASMENLSVKMRVFENDIQHMKEGLALTVRPDAFPALKIAGKITKVDQVASRQGFLSELREFTVRGKYEGIYQQLRSGMNCRVTVHADAVPDAVQVPVLAVFSQEGEHYCLVKDGDRADRRQVKVGATNGKYVEITEGLRPGERVTLYDPDKE